MRTITWVLCISACLLCLVPVLIYEQGRYHFNESKKHSLRTFSENAPRDTTDPLLVELAFRRQYVRDAVRSASYPMHQDPYLIYALHWCESYGCELALVWLGSEIVTGVQVDFNSGESCSMAFDVELLNSISRKRGLAKEISLELPNGSCGLKPSNVDAIETVRLLGVQNKPIGVGVKPRINQMVQKYQSPSESRGEDGP